MTRDEAFDRRRVERVRLREPLTGLIGEDRITVMEVGLLGVQIEVRVELETGSDVDLLFVWGAKRIAFATRVAWVAFDHVSSEVAGETIYQAGLEFVAAIGDSEALVRELVTATVTGYLETQRANARGETRWLDSSIAREVGKVDSASRERSHYICCQPDGAGGWRRSTILKPMQPRTGFTVRGTTPDAEIEALCRSWNDADADGQHLIRLCAELSVRDEVDGPLPRREIV